MADSLIRGGRPLGKGAIQDAIFGDAVLVEQLLAYKRRVAGNYRPLRPENIGELQHGRMWVSPKIDGELWFLVCVQSQVVLVNPRGRAIAGELPLLHELAQLPAGTIIAGELHAAVEGRRSRVGDLAALMDEVDVCEPGRLCFAAFDLLQDGGVQGAATYELRLKRLQEMLPARPGLSVTPTEVLNTASDVQARFDTMVLSGQQEGLIVRLEKGLIHKLKPAIHVDAAVIGYTVKLDQPSLVRSVLLGLLKEDGSWVVLGSCGSLGTDAQRDSLMKSLSPSVVPSKVRYASESGSLYTFVKPELVAEVVVTDLLGDLSDGQDPKSIWAHFDGQGWSGLGMTACPKMIGPVLERLRSDKKADLTDIRVAQVVAYLDPDLPSIAAAESFAPSTVFRREVWTKENKGQTAVRKLVVWKTNKEASDPRFPAFVVHWTDYSAGRASPLDREVRPAPDEAAATAIVDALIVENIKKGWNKVS